MHLVAVRRQWLHRRSTFQRPKLLAETAESLGPETAYAKVCPIARSCDLYALGAAGAQHLGAFDNIDDAIRMHRRLSTEEARD